MEYAPEPGLPILVRYGRLARLTYQPDSRRSSKDAATADATPVSRWLTADGMLWRCDAAPASVERGSTKNKAPFRPMMLNMACR